MDKKKNVLYERNVFFLITRSNLFFSYQNYDIISYDINIVSIKNKKLLIHGVINLFSASSIYFRCQILVTILHSSFL